MPEYDEGTAYEEIGTAEVSMSDVMDDAPADDPDDNYLEDVVTEDPFGFDFDFDGATTSPTCVVGRDSDRAAWEGWCRFGGGVGWVLGAVFMEMAAGERENRKKIAMARGCRRLHLGQCTERCWNPSGAHAVQIRTVQCSAIHVSGVFHLFHSICCVLSTRFLVDTTRRHNYSSDLTGGIRPLSARPAAPSIGPPMRSAVA